ncbi:hypothetical protein PVK06_024064 [Gossypium arboreum]|uniref:Uncharacterized protein n=1 Tax=Gossypium arboreum TaxID=29729 RepID=A0ABR0PCX7_GOSAR|nr:hypothetical protein PVK06_024064 [Gossypium arboreum]
MVEQSMGLDKKSKPPHVMGKRFRTASSHPMTKRTREYRELWREPAKWDTSNRMQDRQSIVSFGSVKGLTRAPEMPSCEEKLREMVEIIKCLCSMRIIGALRS